MIYPSVAYHSCCADRYEKQFFQQRCAAAAAAQRQQQAAQQLLVVAQRAAEAGGLQIPFHSPGWSGYYWPP